MKIEELAFIEIIDVHEGRHSHNGGEYSYGRRLWLNEDELWEVEYFASAEFEFCPVHGVFQGCHTCPSRWEEGDCSEESSTMRSEEVEELIQKFGIDIRRTNQYKWPYGYIDSTGHEYHACKYDGGCVICYPCGHGC